MAARKASGLHRGDVTALRRYGTSMNPGKGVHGLCIIVDRKGMLSEKDVVLCVPYYQNPTSIFYSRADKWCYGAY